MKWRLLEPPEAFVLYFFLAQLLVRGGALDTAPHHALATECRIMPIWYQLGTGTDGERFPCAEQLGKPLVSQQGALALLRMWQQLSSALGRESIIRLCI